MSKKIPVYYHDGQYAREHDELEMFRESHKANIQCRDAIECAIAHSFDGFHLDGNAVDEVFEKFSAERIALVLAATVQVKDWDERFSRSNREWAATVGMPECMPNALRDRRDDYVVKTHPAVLDGFIGLVRKKLYAVK